MSANRISLVVLSLLTIWHICHILNIERKLEITMDKFEVEFYTKDNGEKPAKDFILGLDVKMRAKVLGIIDVLEEKGNQLREPYSKHLEDGIFEIRGKVGTDITRVLYFFLLWQENCNDEWIYQKNAGDAKTGNKTGKVIS